MSDPTATMSLTESSNTFNVSDEVFTEARRHALEIIPTGGGNDFVWRKFSGFTRDTTHEIVLQDGMTGESPKIVKQTTNMVVYFSSDWTDFLELEFPTCELAMQRMSDEVFLIKLAELVHDTRTKRTLDRYWANAFANLHQCKVVHLQLS